MIANFSITIIKNRRVLFSDTRETNCQTSTLYLANNLQK